MKKLLLLLSCFLLLGCGTQSQKIRLPKPQVVRKLPAALPGPKIVGTGEKGDVEFQKILFDAVVSRINEHEEAIETMHDRENKLEARIAELENKLGRNLEKNLIELDKCQGK